jgi:hypothetical protein
LKRPGDCFGSFLTNSIAGSWRIAANRRPISFQGKGAAAQSMALISAEPAQYGCAGETKRDRQRGKGYQYYYEVYYLFSAQGSLIFRHFSSSMIIMMMRPSITPTPVKASDIFNTS